MDKTFKAGVIITGDESGGVRAFKNVGAAANAFNAQAKQGTAVAAGYRASLQQVGSQAVSMAGGLRTAIAGIAATFAVGAGIKFVLDNTVEAERSVTRINAVLKATGGVSGQTSESLQAMAGEMQNVTEFSDDAVMAAQSVLLTFDKIGGDVFPKTVRVAADLAAVLGGDISSAAQTLGKALQDPAEGLASLSRLGIRFDESTKETIKVLSESGQVIAAQNMVLDELKRRVGGAAEAMRNDLGGAASAVKNAFGDLLEGQGGSVSELTGQLNQLTMLLRDPNTKEGFAALTAGVLNIAGVVVSATSGFANGVVAIKEWAAEQVLLSEGLSGDLGTSLLMAKDRVTNLRKALQEPFATEADTTRQQKALEDAEYRVKAFTLAVRDLASTDVAKAIAPVFNAIDRITGNQSSEFMVPFLAAAETSVDTMGVLMTSTQQAAKAQEELGRKEGEAAAAAARAQADRKKAAEEAAKAIQTANQSADQQNKQLSMQIALIESGVPVAEAARRAQLQANGVTSDRIKLNRELAGTVDRYAEAESEAQKAKDAAKKADEARLKDIDDANKSVAEEILQLTQVNDLIARGVDARLAEEQVRLRASGADPARIAELEALRERNRLLVEGQQQLGEAAKAAAAAQVEAYNRAADRIESIFGDLFNAALRGFDDFRDQLQESFRNLLAEMALQATKNQILIPIQTAILGQAPGSAALGGFDAVGALSKLGSYLGFGGGASGAGLASGGSISAGAGSFASGAGLNATSAFGSSAAGGSLAGGGGAAAGLAPTSMGAFGFYAAAAYIGYELGSAIKGEWKTQSQDVALSITGGLVDATIETERKKKRLGRDDKNQLIVDEATRLDGVLSNTFGSIYDSIVEAGDLIGASAGDFTFTISESIKGLQGPELDAALAGILEKASITLAGQVIPNWIAWQREGESSAQTVIRLANETAGLRESFIDLGYTMQGGREISVELGQQLAVAAGGMDRLQAGMASYYQNFYSEAERQANATGRLTSAVVELGYAFPASRTGFRDLVNGIDLSTEANRKAYATLLSLSDAAGAYYTQLEEDAKAAAQLQFDIATAQRRAEREAAESAMRRRVEEKQAQAEAFDIAMTAIGTLDLTAQQFLENTRKGLYGNQVAIAGRNLLKDPDYDYGLSFANREGKLTPQAVALDAVLKNITRQTDLVGTVMDLVGNRLAPQDRTADRALEGVFNVRPPREVTEAWSAANQAVVTITAQSRDLTASFDAGSISAAAYATENAALAASLDATRRQIEGFKGAYPGPFTRARNLLSSLFDQIEARVAGLQDAASEIIAPIQTATAELKSMGDAFDTVADQLGLKVLSVRNYDDTYGTPAATQRYIDVTEGKYGKRYDQAVAGSEVATEFGDAIKLALAQSVGLEGTDLADKSSLIAGITKGDAESLEGAYLRLTAELGKYREKGDLAYVLGYDGGGKAIGGGVATEKVGISPEEYRLLADQALKAFTDGADAISESASQWKQISESLTSYRRELDGASASRLTIEQQYLAAQTEYQSVRQLALSSDVDAAERFQSVAEAFRLASMAQFGSGGGYFADLEGIKSAVDTVGGLAKFEADLPQQQLSAINTGNGYLKSMETNIAKLVAANEKQSQQIIALTAEAAKKNLEGQAKIADSLSSQAARARASA